MDETTVKSDSASAPPKSARPAKSAKPAEKAKMEKLDKADKAGDRREVRGPGEHKELKAVPASGPETRPPSRTPDETTPRGLPAAAAGGDAVAETSILLDSIIHDLRTPLSAMSGWLEVLESHFGEADGIVGRALLGLRRGVDSQTSGLTELSDVLAKQRIDLPVSAECLLLERLQQAVQRMEESPDSAVSRAAQLRLSPFKKISARGSLTCRDAGSSLLDACGTLLHAVAVAQGDDDAPLSITANADHVLVTVPGSSGDSSGIISICHGLAGYTGKRPEIRAQALWLARATFQRCGLSLGMSPAPGGGFNLLISKPGAPAS